MSEQRDESEIVESAGSGRDVPPKPESAAPDLPADAQDDSQQAESRSEQGPRPQPEPPEEHRSQDSVEFGDGIRYEPEVGHTSEETAPELVEAEDMAEPPGDVSWSATVQEFESDGEGDRPVAEGAVVEGGDQDSAPELIEAEDSDDSPEVGSPLEVLQETDAEGGEQIQNDALAEMANQDNAPELIETERMEEPSGEDARRDPITGGLNDATFERIDQTHGPRAGQRVDDQVQRMHDGSSTALDQVIPGTGRDPEAIYDDDGPAGNAPPVMDSHADGDTEEDRGDADHAVEPESQREGGDADERARLERVIDSQDRQIGRLEKELERTVTQKDERIAELQARVAELESRDQVTDVRGNPGAVRQGEQESREARDDRPWYKKVAEKLPDKDAIALGAAGSGFGETIAANTHHLSSPTQAMIVAGTAFGVAGYTVGKKYADKITSRDKDRDGNNGG